MIISENRFPLFGIMLRWGLGAARLVSTPSRCRAWLGIAVERFPRVWAVLRPRFPAAHSKASSPLRLPFRHARVARTAIPTRRGVAKATAGAWPRGREKVLTGSFLLLYILSKERRTDFRCRTVGTGSGRIPPATRRGSDERGRIVNSCNHPVISDASELHRPTRRRAAAQHFARSACKEQRKYKRDRLPMVSVFVPNLWI